ncbi:MAG: hypothetical protein PHQ65_10725 [Bacteroidales bacterium]|nr:hypothetical protein [Bacteroidales bacterium]MDD3665727.1 hypothetical protein [Bacteroidales bacterium]
MKPFLTRLLWFLTIPLAATLLLAGGYVINDPFEVLRPPRDFSHPAVVPNRDFISTTIFLRQNPTQQYDSFIFGSSRTMGFKPSHWQKFLPDGAKVFMFDASQESVYGISTKLEWLDRNGVEIKNVLIVLCRDYSFANTTNHKGHLFIKHPATSGENPLWFHVSFFRAYTSPRFLAAFYGYKLIGGYRPFMRGYIEQKDITYDTLTNETNIVDQELEITTRPDQYYAKRAKVFYNRAAETTDPMPRITPEAKKHLETIARILQKHQTNYRVVMSPLYEQIKLNPADANILKQTFGNRFFDFTGANTFTNDKHNYYETNHFRPKVGDSIMRVMYSPETLHL